MNRTYRPADGDESGWGSDEWDSSDDDDQTAPQAVSNQSVPPPLPPKDNCTSASHLYMNTDYKGSGRKLPRILPVITDGQKSKYYYFIVPERNKDPDRPTVCSPITAEVRPFAVGGVHIDSTKRKPEERYQNLNFHKFNMEQTVAPSFGGSTQQGASLTVMQSDSGNIGGAIASDASLISWSGLTGMTPVGTVSASSEPCPQDGASVSGNNNNDDQNTFSNNTPSVSSQQRNTASVSMTSVRQKIIEVQRQVHGVTQDECNAALSNNRWNVESAVRYLKVEQLFRLGIAPKERCQNLLESLKWNLQMAGSVLLDEVSTGSAV